MNRPTAFLLLAALFAGACDHATMSEDTPAVGVEWRLETIQPAGGAATAVDPARYSLLLDASGRASLRSDCNSCGGGYTLAGKAVGFGPLACTRAYCGDASFDPEYPRILEGATSIEADGSRLRVSGAAGTLVYTR